MNRKKALQIIFCGLALLLAFVLGGWAPALGSGIVMVGIYLFDEFRNSN